MLEWPMAQCFALSLAVPAEGLEELHGVDVGACCGSGLRFELGVDVGACLGSTLQVELGSIWPLAHPDNVPCIAWHLRGLPTDGGQDRAA